MKLTLEQSRKMKSAKMLLLAGMILGPLYNLFEDGIGSWIPFVNTWIIGVIIAIIVALIELLVLTGNTRNLSFYKILSIRIILYTVLITGTILLVMIFSRMLQYDLNFRQVCQSAEFQNYMNEEFLMGNFFALMLITIVIFIMQMRRKIGPEILMGFISGKNYHPREVERIVMFVQVQKIKSTIEKLGRLKFFQYLNDIIFDLTESVLFHKGNIYEYVENEVLLIWEVKKGTENANCIRTFFEILEVFEANKINYFEKYGIVPSFKASLHVGKMIMGEIGDVKSEISYHGDVMNTASRILGKTSSENNFLISADLMEMIQLPELYQKIPMGKFDLRGKHEEVELYSLKESETITM